jgi:hypothetical protein
MCLPPDIYRIAMMRHREAVAEAEGRRPVAQARAGRGTLPQPFAKARHTVGVALVSAARHLQGTPRVEPPRPRSS